MKHDESIDVKRLAFVGVKTILAPSTRGTVKCLVITPQLRLTIGIKQWGRVDFLTKYCHYRVISSAPNGSTVISNGRNYRSDNDNNVEKKSARQIKKEQKTPKLTNKKKK